MHAKGAVTAVPATSDLSTLSAKDLVMRHAPAIHRLAGTRPSRLRRVAGALGALAFLGVAGLAFSVAPALAEDCPNAALRAENNSTRLPECRAYEMVTPLYKEGFSVAPQTFSDDGAVAYDSIGNFAGSALGPAGNEYLATRSSTGWATTSLDPPAATYATTILAFTEGLSSDLRSSLWISQRGEPPADDGRFYYRRGPDGSMTRVGRGAIPGVINEGAYTQETSADLSHVVFAHGSTGNGRPDLAALYEYVGTGNEGPPRSVSVDNTGATMPGEACPEGVLGGRVIPGMSADGRVIVLRGYDRVAVWVRRGRERLTTTLRRAPWTVPQAVPFGDAQLKPLRGGETLAWRLA